MCLEKRILGGEFTKEFTDIDNEGDGNGFVFNLLSLREKGPPNGIHYDTCRIEKKLEELYAAASTSELVVGERAVRKRMGLDKV